MLNLPKVILCTIKSELLNFAIQSFIQRSHLLCYLESRPKLALEFRRWSKAFLSLFACQTDRHMKEDAQRDGPQAVQASNQQPPLARSAPSAIMTMTMMITFCSPQSRRSGACMAAEYEGKGIIYYEPPRTATARKVMNREWRKR